jgi:hypothetical protein
MFMQPQTPSQQFDFITKDGPAASKKGFKLPSTGLPKILTRSILIVFILAILIVVYSIIAGSSGSRDEDYIGALARGQEIIRVSTNVGQLSQNPSTQNLAATIQASLTSQQSQITTYLTGQKVKVSTAQLNADQNSSTDSQMQTASTNGNLDDTYYAYLKTQLGVYQNDLQTAYKSAGPHGKVILTSAYNSVQVILQSSQLASA